MKQLILCVASIALLSACSSKTNDNPKAEVTASVDVDNTKDSVKEALDDAGRKIEKGADKAKAKLEDAGDAIKDKYEETKDKLSDDKKSIKVEVKKD
jgi:hypothetical protein